jgi:hypothetical protein
MGGHVDVTPACGWSKKKRLPFEETKMIYTAYIAETNEISLNFNREGGALLVEMVQDLLNGGKQDHFHLSAGPSEICGHKQLPEFCALSLTSFLPEGSAEIAEMMTLAYRPDVPV